MVESEQYVAKRSLASPLTPYGLRQQTEEAQQPTTLQEELRDLEQCLLVANSHLDRIAPRPNDVEKDLPSDGVIGTLRRVRRLATDIEQRAMFLANTIGQL